MLKKPHKQPALPALYTLSPQATPEAVHLLCQMLVFDPVSIKIFCVSQTNLGHFSKNKNNKMLNLGKARDGG
jgi:hypothetical protein